MPPCRSSFTALNVSQESIPEFMGSFTLSAPPNTDLWRKPPAQNISTAPILFTALRNPFVAAEVTVTADWELEWDQGGLVIFAGIPPGTRFGPAQSNSAPTTTSSNSADSQSVSTGQSTSRTNPPSTSTPPTASLSNPPSPAPSSPTPPAPIPSTQPPPAYTAPTASKWLKVGLEYTSSTPHCASVFASTDGADYSISTLPSHPPLFPAPPSYPAIPPPHPSLPGTPHHHANLPFHPPPPPPPIPRRIPLRIKIERIGYALWVWYLDPSAIPDPLAAPNAHPAALTGWKKIREVTWFFWGVDDKSVRVGVYASRPVRAAPVVPPIGRRRGWGAEVDGRRDLCVEFEGLEIF